MTDDPCYSTPFLKEVIARFDFANPIDSYANRLPNVVANTALASFPISEPRQSVSREVQISDTSVKENKTEFMEWNYYGRDREKRLCISPGVVFVTYSTYTTYENLRHDLISVVNTISQDQPTTMGRRLGLRYINNLEMPGRDPFSWDDMLQPQMLGLLKHYPQVAPLTRIFHAVEFRFESVNVKFQFGLPNPDHPAVIRRPVFILDLDASVTELLEPPRIAATLDACHQRIQGLFEQSITDALREKMGNGRKS